MFAGKYGIPGSVMALVFNAGMEKRQIRSGLGFFATRRIKIRIEATCQSCKKKAICSRFPIDDELPDNGLGPWFCKCCWKKAMKWRRGHEMRTLPWPKKDSIPLRMSHQGNTTKVSMQDYVRAVFGGRPE